jgi:hypothetical protein
MSNTQSLSITAALLVFSAALYAFGMQVIYITAALAGLLFALGSVGAIIELFSLKPGDGSVLTALVLGIPFISGSAALLLWYGLDGMGWW